MQPVLERGSIDKPLTFDVGLIQLSFIPVCSPNISLARGEERAHEFLLQRVAVAIQRGNAASVLGSM